MKFGKSLSNQIEETLPEWREKFLSYKDFKKRLKLIGAGAGAGGEKPAKRARVSDGGKETAAMSKEEEYFHQLLEAELEKFNGFFVEKEEEYIIRLKEVQDRVAEIVGKESNKMELVKARKEIVDFHGEMVLLENYSALNYTGLVKILKKYDKRTGALIRLPFIQNVLQQPFFTIDLLYMLVKECEALLDNLFSKSEPSSTSTGEDCDDEGNKEPPKPGSSSPRKGEIPELEEIEFIESLYMKSTLAALRALKEIRSGSSTVSVFSLPPLHSNSLGERWSQVPVVEQVAK